MKIKRNEAGLWEMLCDGIEIKAVSLDKSDISYLAAASAEKLSSLLPGGYDFDKNYDLLGIAFNAYTPNLGNKNGHMIDGERGIAIASMFKGKYLNIEHNRANVIGCITDYGFSSYPDDDPITEDEAKALAKENKIFNVALSGIIWKAVNPDFADAVALSSDKSSDTFGSISASWEVAFKEFAVAKGSKYLAECNILDSDDGEKKKDNLKIFGGTGYDADGKPLFLLLAGDSILSLGVGLTETPAADVRGIVSTETDNSTITANLTASKKNNEETESLNVIEKEKQTIIMQIKDIKDINDESLKQISASAITKFIEEKLAATSEDWKKKVDEKETAASTLSAEIATVKAELETIKTEKEDLGKKLSDLEAAALAKEADEAFQNRMTLIDDKFELSDEDRQFVVEEVKACASAEDFDKWMNKFSVLAKEKSKEVIAAKAKELEDLRKNISVVKASEEGETKTEVKTEEVETEEVKTEVKTEEKVAEKVAEVISEAKVKTEIPNSQSVQESLKDRMAKAFSGDNVKVSYRK